MNTLRSVRRVSLVPFVKRRDPSHKLSTFPEANIQSQKLASEKRPGIASSCLKPVSSWTKERTTSWLSNVQPLEEDKQVWNSHHMDGKSLLLITPDMLEKCGMKFSAALGIVSKIQKLLGPRPNDIPQTLDANSLLDFIVNHPKLQEFLKQDFSVPTKLARNRAKFACVGRQDAFKEAYAAMAERLHLRAENPTMVKERQNNPLPATIATTGGGKSFFLDEIGSLREEDLQLCEDPAMRGILTHTVAVAITFNSGFPITESIDNDPKRRSLGLAVRALYSYFFKTETLDFGIFVRILKPFEDLDLRLAVRCIATHSGKGVLLLVDELMKTAQCGQNNPDNIVTQIGICLNAFPSEEFNVVVTTLNMGAFVFETASAGRRISWIKLQRAKLHDANSLFGEDVDHFPALALCIADCNGHYRSLETLKVVWDKPKSKDLSYLELIKKLGDELEEKYSALEIPHIRAALLGAPVRFDATVPGLKYTFAQCLEMGFFLNTPGKVSVKKTPWIRLACLSLESPLFSCGYLLTAMLVIPNGVRAIASMLKLEPNFTYQQYETFHAHWESLIRLVHGGSPQTISELLYPGTLSTTSKDPTLYLLRKSHELYSWTTHFPQKYSKNATLPTFPEGALTRHIIVPAVNNPGFDIVAFEENPAAKFEPIVICTECRFSDPASTSSLNKDAVAKKHALTLEQFRPYFEEGKQLDGLTIKESNLFLVICAFREVNANAFEDLPANTIVLNRDMLKKLYSPSLASRPQFLLPLKDGDSGTRIE